MPELDTFIGSATNSTCIAGMQTKKKETDAMNTVTTNFYVEQTQCDVCNRPTTRIGVPEIDAMKGKEPVICGFCLREVLKTTPEQVRKIAD
jgi:hypothetical protein